VRGRRSDYARFAELSDRREAGQPLEPALEREYEELATADAASALELALLRECGQLLEPRAHVHDAAESHIIEGALTRVAERDKVVTFPPLREQRSGAALRAAGTAAAHLRRTGRRRLTYLGAAALVAAGALATFASVRLVSVQRASVREVLPDAGERARTGRPPSAPGIGLASEGQHHAELTFVEGRLLVDGVQARVGSAPVAPGARVEVAEGGACLSLERDLDVCLLEGTRVRLDAGGDGPRVLELEKGWVGAALAKRPSERRFAIRSGPLEATALGTLFAVERREGAPSDVTFEVSVAEGHVQVRTGGDFATADASAHGAFSPDQGSVLAPGQRLVARSEALDPPEAVSRSHLATLFATMNKRHLWRPDSVGVLTIDASRDDGVVTLDGEVLGTPPLSLLVGSGSHRVVWSDAAGGMAEEQRVSVSPGGTTEVGRPRSSGAASQPSRRAESASLLPEQLLGRARQELQAGQHASAAATYRALRAEYPARPEAHTVLVTLGQLELDRLGQPALALQSFEAYLRSGGPLLEEARRGQIRALQALGATARERAAIRLYLERYPRSLSAAELRRRLERLDP